VRRRTGQVDGRQPRTKTAEAVSTGGRSGTLKTPDGLLDVTLGNPLEKGIEKQEALLDKRLAAMNEFRQALKDQNGTFITRTEFEAKHELLNVRVAAAEKLLYVAMGIGIVLELALRFVK